MIEPTKEFRDAWWAACQKDGSWSDAAWEIWQIAQGLSNKHSYTTGVEIYKNEWPIPPGTKLGKRPTQNLVREGHSPGCALPDDHEHACGGFIRIPTKTPE